MSNDFHNSDEQLSNKELTLVNSALDALENHTHQPTTNAWEAIMEDSRTRSRHISRRTQLMSVAAAAAVVIAITGTVIALASNGGTKNIKTVSRKKHHSHPVHTVPTSTTIPLTPQQKLLHNTITVKDVELPVDSVNRGNDMSLDLYDTESGKKIVELPRGDKYPAVSITSYNGDTLTGTGLAQDGEFSNNFVYFVKTGKLIDTGDMLRIYSPSEKMYIELLGNDLAIPQAATIVNTQTGARRVLKPQTDPFGTPLDDNGDIAGKAGDATIYISAVKWLDDTRFAYVAQSEGSNGLRTTSGSMWKIADLNKTIDIASDPAITPYPQYGGDLVSDVRLIDGNIYFLVQESDADSGRQSLIAYQYGENNKDKKIWSRDMGTTGTSKVLFGNDVHTIYGSTLDNYGGISAFAYDNATNTFVQPGGVTILSRN